MALQTLTLDPNAQAYTDNEIVDKINAGTNAINRPTALDYDALDIVRTGPPSGHKKVKQINVNDVDKFDVIYDDVPVP